MATSTIKQTANNTGSGYCKMPDGTLMCWGREENVSLEAEEVKNIELTFPVTFYSLPSLAITVNKWDDPDNFPTGVRSESASTPTIRVKNNRTDAQTVNVEWLAIGRWKA